MRPFLKNVVAMSVVAWWLLLFKTSSVLWRNERSPIMLDDSPRHLLRAKEQPTIATGQHFETLPKRLITVFGLESSGTTLLAETLAKAVSAEEHKLIGGLSYRTRDSHVEIQHVSLPSGYFHGLKNQTVVDIDFLPPPRCMTWPHYSNPVLQSSFDNLKAHPKCLKETGLQERVKLPLRFMVNITSHVLWYQKRGVVVTAVIMVRDDYTHIHGKRSHNQNNLSSLWLEDLHSKQNIAHALKHLSSSNTNGPPELVIVSYETLMSLQKPYLSDLYRQLGIRSAYMPLLKNGNKKYVMPLNGTDNETWWSLDPATLEEAAS